MRKKFEVYTLSSISSVIFSGITPKSGGDAYIDAGFGVPFIRSGNINADGSVNETADVWIKPEIHTGLMNGSRLMRDDILIAIVGATIGKAGIYKSDKEANINQAIAAIRLNDKKFLPEYVLCYLQSSMGQTWLSYLKRPVARANINLEEIGSIEIPHIPIEKQTFLMAQMATAKQSRAAKIREADELLAGIDDYVLGCLGIKLESLNSELIYDVKLGDILNSEIYCRPTYPCYLRIIRALKESAYYQGELEKYVAVNPQTDCTKLSDNEMVSFVPMTAVGCKDNKVIYEERAYKDVKVGYTVFQRGDLLWAKITPCMQNGKSCIVADMPTRIGFGSTEFHILRKKSDEVHLPYVWALLSNRTVLQAAQAVFNGSAGQQRVSDSFLKHFPLPLPDIKIQKEIADSIVEMLDKIELLRCKAETEWAAAKEQFERELIGE